MKKILFVDAYTPAHVGNGVLLNSSINVIRRSFPDASIRFLSLETETPAQVTDLPYDGFLFQFPVGLGVFRKCLWVMRESVFIATHTLNQLSFRCRPSALCRKPYRVTALRQIENADIVISITGENINDRTRHVLPFLLFTYWLAISLKKKMVIFPQSIGPLNRNWTRAMTAFVLKRCALVVGRDQFSMKELAGLGVPKSISQFCPDVGVVQPYVSSEEAKRILQAQGITHNHKKLIGISVSRPKEEGIANIDHLAIVSDAIKRSFPPADTHILILPANMPLNDKDRGDLGECEAFKAAIPEYDTSILTPRIYRPEEYKGILGLVDLFITSRMHVAILATMAGTPTITLNTQRKLAGYMSNIGQADYSLNLADLTSESLRTVIGAALAELDAIRERLNMAAREMEQEINRFARLIAQELH